VGGGCVSVHAVIKPRRAISMPLLEKSTAGKMALKVISRAITFLELISFSRRNTCEIDVQYVKKNKRHGLRIETHC
jgi:hypothetical protein